jgi:hypothetical protein
VSATVPNTKVCGPPPKQKTIYATVWYIVADEAVLMKFYASFVGVNQAEIYGM